MSGVTTALVLGWAGSTPRQLRSVARFYEGKGAQALTATAQVFRAMARPDGWAIEGERLAAQLLLRPAGPIVVHLFSNAGFWMHAALLRELDSSPAGRAALERIEAVVIDSAPGFPPRIGPRFYARFSSMAMMPMVLHAFGRPPALSHPLLTPPVWAFMRVWYHFSSRQNRSAEESLEIVRSTGSWPHLFVWSVSDSLVTPEYVEPFVESLEAAGRRVERLRFEDTEHVRHMIGHRTEYFDAVARLLATRAEKAGGGSASAP